MFGYAGGAILPVFDAIYNSKEFDLILPRHEQGGAHMAEGYARARYDAPARARVFIWCLTLSRS